MLDKLSAISEIFKNLGPGMTVISIVAATVTYAHTTFSTMKYVDEKHDSVVSTLQSIKADQVELQRGQREMYGILIQLAQKARIQVKE